MAIGKWLDDKERNVAKDYFASSTIMFSMMLALLVCIFGAIWTWPDEKPLFSLDFFAWIFLFPLVASAGVGLLLAGLRWNGKVEQALVEEGIADINDYVTAVASRPLALLGSAYRYSVSSETNAIENVMAGSLTLKLSVPSATQTEPVLGRWFESTAVLRTSVADIGKADHKRHETLTKWLFEALLTELSSNIALIPDNEKFIAYVYVSNNLDRSENLDLWRNAAALCVNRFFLTDLCENDAEGVMSLDKWLDDAISQDGDACRLIIAIQLHSLHARPWFPSGSAEAGTALLLMPDALAKKQGLQTQGNLHRPVASAIDAHAESVSSALQFGGTSGDKIARVWQTGGPLEHSASLSTMKREAGVLTPVIDIDQSVGAPGIAGPWFAVACAHAALCEKGGAQMITTCRDDEISTMVLKPTVDQREYVPRK
jgi:hypothetical protein